tara:strand:- start:288 stop:1415 length:1128 start_codon:yes stop_codon:yes gene_type:complete
MKIGKRILFFADGASQHSEKWITAQQKNGDTCFWISLHKRNINTKEGIEYYEFSQGMILYRIFRAVIFALMLIKKRKIEIVHGHYIGTYGFAAFLVPRPLILTAWGSDILLSPKNSIKRFLIKLIIKRAKIITYDAKHVELKLLELGALANQLWFVNFGVDCEYFNKKNLPNLQEYYSSIGKTEISKRLSQFLDKESFVVLSNRNLEPIYDIETLIKAWKRVNQEKRNYKLIIAGSGSLSSKLESLVKRLELEESILFIGEYNKEELLYLLNNVHIYISTSLSDAGLATSVAEAMACCVPVIVSNFGDNGKWVINDKTGKLFNTSDHIDLSKKIIEIENHKLSEDIGFSGRQIIKKNNDYVTEMNKYFSKFENFF